MKKIIISSKQLNCLNEEETVTIGVNAQNDTLADFSRAATDPNTTADIQKAGNAGDVNLMVTGPNTTDDAPTQMVDVPAGDTLQSAIAKQGNDELTRSGSAMKITGDGFGESKIFSKKTIEEARLKKMRDEGRVMTKKELKESFTATQYKYRVVECPPNEPEIPHSPCDDESQVKVDAKKTVAETHNTCFIERFDGNKWQRGSIRYFWQFGRVCYWNS